MSAGPSVVRHADPAGFLRRGGRWLLEAEAENNLVLGLADRLARGDLTGFEPPVYLATVERERRVVGCAFRTPPFLLGLTRMPDDVLPVLAADVATVYEALPGVLGPDREAGAFARVWAPPRGLESVLRMRQTIYALDALASLENPADGRLRRARPEETGLAADWLAAFQEEAGIPGHDPRVLAEGFVTGGDLFLWEDGVPRTVAAVAARTPHGARIGYVYTPPAHRGRGYATVCSAALTLRVLREGARFCFLYADKANTTANGMYRRIGYRPACDVADYRFGERLS